MRFVYLLIAVIAVGISMIAGGQPVHSSTQLATAAPSAIIAVDQVSSDDAGTGTQSSIQVQVQSTTQQVGVQQVGPQQGTGVVIDTDPHGSATSSNTSTNSGGNEGDIPINTFTTFCGGL